MILDVRTLVAFAVIPAVFIASASAQDDFRIPDDEIPKQFPDPQPTAALIQTSGFIRATEARQQFNVNGNGLTAVVMDTGINRDHKDFAGKIILEKNYTTDNGGNESDAKDGNGHGTNVSGIIVADSVHIGIAPGARLIPIKVLKNANGGSWDSLIKGLTWVDQNYASHSISVVNLSLGDGQNFQSSTQSGQRKQIEDLIVGLRAKKIAVVVAAGNDFFTHSSTQGMSFPAICRGTISTGAVYDANVGAFSYASGAVANSTAAGRVTPFSQRLHTSVNAQFATDVFAPGAPLTSSGIEGDMGQSIQHGTSQAAPVTAGVILLIQELHKRATGDLPTVDQLESWIRTGVVINDGDDEDDNVTNTGKDFIRLDAMSALGAVDGDLRGRLFREGTLKKK